MAHNILFLVLCFFAPLLLSISITTSNAVQCKHPQDVLSFDSKQCYSRLDQRVANHFSILFMECVYVHAIDQLSCFY
jgi:hypothetical protein